MRSCEVKVMSDSLWPHGLSPWNSPGQNTGVGISLSLLQGIFPTQGSNPGLPHCRQILYQLSYGSFRQFSCLVVSNTLRPHELQHARPPCPSPTPGVSSNSCPLSWWCHPAISSSVVPFFSCPNPSQHQGLFQWVNSLHEVAQVLEFQLQHQSFQWTPRTDLL